MKLFISYSRQDEDFVRRLYEAITLKGAEIWWDKIEIKPGEDWSDAIQRGLDECDGMILVVSPESMASRNVADEWKYYHSHNKLILPILIRPTKMHFQLQRLQWIDFQQDAFSDGIQKIVDELGISLPIQTDYISGNVPDYANKEALNRIRKAKSQDSIELSLAWLGLRTIPIELTQLKNLRVLKLNNNLITEVPDEIEKLVDLKRLYVYGNQFTEFPNSILALKNLTLLWMHNNLIQSIPSRIVELTNLEALWIHDNQLESLPVEIGLLENLNSLYVRRNNSLKDIPVEVIKSRDKGILMWLREQAKRL